MLSRLVDALPWLLALPLAGCGIFIDPDEYQDVVHPGSASATNTSSTASSTAGSGGAGGSGCVGGGCGGAGGAGGALPSYRDLVLEDEPIGYWRLGEPAGEMVAIDESGNQENGSYVQVMPGEKGLIPPDPNTAASFAGHDDSYVEVGNSFLFPGHAPFTLEAWFKTKSLDTTLRYVFHALDPNGDGFAVWFYSAELAFYRGSADVDFIAKTMAPPIVLTTTYVVATFDGTALCIFRDFDDMTCTPSSIDITSLIQQVRIGRGVDGWIDEVAIYAHLLPQERIKLHFDAGSR